MVMLTSTPGEPATVPPPGAPAALPLTCPARATATRGAGENGRRLCGYTGGMIALVTGANRGLGREVARQLAQRGMVVLPTARRPPDGGFRQLDVMDPASVQRLAAALEAE